MSVRDVDVTIAFSVRVEGEPDGDTVRDAVLASLDEDGLTGDIFEWAVPETPLNDGPPLAPLVSVEGRTAGFLEGFAAEAVDGEACITLQVRGSLDDLHFLTGVLREGQRSW